MLRNSCALTSIAAFIGLSLACTTSPEPLTPVTPSTSSATSVTTDGSTLKVSAPVPLSPINNQALTTSPLLTATSATLTFGGIVGLQYRFQLFNPTNVMTQDSGLVNTPSFQVTATLTVNTRYTWRVRAELYGAVGPWSSTASFISPQSVSVASVIATQEGAVLWPGVQPTGTNGQATLGDNWEIQTLFYAPGNTFFPSPTLEMLRFFDLFDRGFDPQSAIDWMNSHGYPTGAQWYPPPEKAVLGLQFVYIAARNKVVTNGTWDIVVKAE